MGQALYRKYRSRAFDEVVGQEPIVQTLKKALRSGRINHAYLLTGPKGVGKTSVARILAHEVNKLPYKDESTHLDIIEIDAASNRRIDEIRDIREKVHIAPTSARYKVYIIDEVHMLTTEAFNALLKTLEEPPEHCIFILATTEAHKLPATIISRTQRYIFKPVAKELVASHLGAIAKREKILIEPAALELLAEYGEGSLRDSISLLDQLSSYKGKVTAQKVEELLGLAPSGQIDDLLELVLDGQRSQIIDRLNELRLQGVSAAQVAASLAGNIRQQILQNNSVPAGLTELLKQLLEVPMAKQPYERLEIALLEASFKSKPTAEPLVEPIPEVESETNPEVDVEEDVSDVESETPTPVKPPKAGSGKFNLELWPQVLAEVKKRAASVYTALRLAEPKLDNGILVLEFQFALHRDKVNQSRNRDLIGDVIHSVSADNLNIETALVQKKKPAKKPEPPKPKTDDDLNAINNIFGSAEVLES